MFQNSGFSLLKSLGGYSGKQNVNTLGLGYMLNVVNNNNNNNNASHQKQTVCACRNHSSLACSGGSNGLKSSLKSPSIPLVDQVRFQSKTRKTALEKRKEKEMARQKLLDVEKRSEQFKKSNEAKVKAKQASTTAKPKEYRTIHDFEDVSEAINDSNEITKRIYSVDNASAVEQKKLKIKQTMQAVLGEGITASPGSSECQVAAMTIRIQDMLEHVKTHKKDHRSKRQLEMLVFQRKRMLLYLRRSSITRYARCLEVLNIPPVTQSRNNKHK